MRSREVLIGVVCLLIGLAGGFFAANTLNRQQTALEQGTTAAVADPSVVRADETLNDVNSTLEAATNNPQDFGAQMRAGDMYAQIGRFEKAVEFYKRGVLINPSNFQANVVLANALFDSQKFEEAEAYYSKAVQIDPNDPNVRTDLAATFVERSVPDYDRAITELTTVRKATPSHLPSLYYLGIATLRKGDRAKANEILKELEKIGPTSDLVGKLRQNIEATQ